MTGVGLCADVPEGITNAPVADEPTVPDAVNVVADTEVAVMVVPTAVFVVVAPKVPFNAPVAGPIRPNVPSKRIDIT